MPRIDIIVALLAVCVPLVALARSINVGYPVVLVLGGLVLCFIPGLPRVEIHPQLIFMVVLPPLLYWQAFTAPTGEMRSNLSTIGSLAIGLVLATAVAVALIAKGIVPGLAWPAAIALGAIVAPTDDVAFWPIAERLRLPRRVAALVGGEALLNDAPALVLYGVAVAAAVSGTFSPAHVGLRLLWVVPCSIAVGMLVGRLVSLAWANARDPQLQTIISVIAPYLAYLPAAQIGLSGVLAVVTAGVWVNRTSPKVLTPEARQRAAGFWETTVLLMNAIMFVLIGFHLHDTLPTLGRPRRSLLSPDREAFEGPVHRRRTGLRIPRLDIRSHRPRRPRSAASSPADGAAQRNAGVSSGRALRLRMGGARRAYPADLRRPGGRRPGIPPYPSVLRSLEDVATAAHGEFVRRGTLLVRSSRHVR